MLDSSKRQQYYFEQICKIPHVTFNEKALSDYIVSIAKKNNLAYVQDDMYNVLVKVPASKGYEDHPSIMLQGHIDMVATKANGSTFNFDTDPIELVLEGNILRANGTTLGADDGVATGIMLALMEEDCKHPPLELMFTVQEEIGFVGALHFDVSHISSKRMIGLDCVGEHVVTVGNYCSDLVHLIIEKEKVSNTEKGYLVHFGDLEAFFPDHQLWDYKANAAQYFATLMLESGCDFKLGSINGGRGENFPMQGCDIEIICDEEVLKTMPFVSYKEALISAVYSSADSKYIFKKMTEVPNGCLAYTTHMVTSHIFGKIVTEGNKITMIGSTRSESVKLNNETLAKLRALDLTMETSPRYQGWPETDKHELKDLYAEVSKEVFGKETVEKIDSGGLEIAVFLNKIEDLDVLAIGPIDGGAHSSKEWLDLDSYDRFYHALKVLLERC